MTEKVLRINHQTGLSKSLNIPNSEEIEMSQTKSSGFELEFDARFAM
jgi:hypothetical protein